MFSHLLNFPLTHSFLLIVRSLIFRHHLLNSSFTHSFLLMVCSLVLLPLLLNSPLAHSCPLIICQTLCFVTHLIFDSPFAASCVPTFPWWLWVSMTWGTHERVCWSLLMNACISWDCAEKVQLPERKNPEGKLPKITFIRCCWASHFHILGVTTCTVAAFAWAMLSLIVECKAGIDGGTVQCQEMTVRRLQ